MLALARSGGADVISTIEPIGSQIARAGYGTRWKSMAETAPWYPQVIMVASQSAVEKNAEALRRFATTYARVTDSINKANGVWTPEVTAAMAKWTKVDAKSFTTDPMPQYSPAGPVSVETLARIQDIWTSQGLLKDPVDPNLLVAPGFAATAAAGGGS